MARLPDELIERIKREVPLTDLCREYGIELSGHGKNLKAKSPFREEKDASFIVTPSTNLWNDLGAGGRGGSNIDLVMLMEKVSFRRAAEKLAGRLGLAPQAAAITTKVGTEHDILAAPGDALTDAQLMGIVTDFYHATFCNQPQAMQYLQKRKCFHPEAVKRFRIGYANRTLGYRVPATTAAGRELKERLQKLGVLRKETGHEHLNGSVVFPITDRIGGIVTQLYGRKITDGLRKGTPLHLYLEQPKRGLWNPESVMPGGELIVCEAVLDALTFWCAGFRNVTCTFGANGINEDLWALLHDKRPRWIVMAQDNDKAGNDAVEKLAPRLAELGIGVKRVALPPDVDVNALACQSADASKALAVLLEESAVLVAHANTAAVEQTEQLKKEAAPKPAPILDPQPMPEPEPQPAASFLAASDAAPPPQPLASSNGTGLHAEQRGEDLFFKLGDREYRVRGLAKNTSFEALKINLRVRLDDDRYHQDNVDMARAKEREHFARVAAAEISVKEEAIKRDLSRLLLKLEELQEESIRRSLEPKGPAVPGMTEAERDEALALLKSADLAGRIVADFGLRVVGERDNALTGYLAAVSRKLERPLAIIVQSTSAAGKSSLMEAILAFMPEEERIKYSAMTGQSLYYLGEKDLRHKILAIVEEEGAEKASYALKLLQSEGELTIASTGKDPVSGKMVTQEYRVEGPVMIFLTTTAIDIDEELMNRCLILTVDESREQTRAIHALQREARTLEGIERKGRLSAALRVHRNAQRLLRPLAIVNPFAGRLTFQDSQTRTRRDHEKYLTLIDSIALLHQYQRGIKRTATGSEYVEATLADIALANRLAGEVLGRSLDEMPPQTRSFLEAVFAAVGRVCAEKEIEQRHYRFTQREVRRWTGASAQQVKRHLAKLVDLEYALIHRGGRGQSFVYELLYSGEGERGGKFVMGLIDPEKLKENNNASAARTYDANRDTQNPDRDMQNGHRDTPGSGQVHGWDTGGSPAQNGANPSKQEPSQPMRDQMPENTQPAPAKKPARRNRNATEGKADAA